MTQLLTPSSRDTRNKASHPLAVILLGPPGAGKGTHADPLSASLQIPHISTGALFRDNIQQKTPLGLTAAVYINEGKLVPDSLVLDMLFARVSQPDCQRGYILDGFPRTVEQGKALDQKIGATHQILVLNFLISDELLVERITGRIGCNGCGKTFHKLHHPPKQAGLCDGCGKALTQREDDTENILRKRLNAYHLSTKPLINYYAQKKGVLWNIDAQGTKESVFSQITLCTKQVLQSA